VAVRSLRNAERHPTVRYWSQTLSRSARGNAICTSQALPSSVRPVNGRVVVSGFPRGQPSRTMQSHILYRFGCGPPAIVTNACDQEEPELVTVIVTLQARRRSTWAALLGPPKRPQPTVARLCSLGAPLSKPFDVPAVEPASRLVPRASPSPRRPVALASCKQACSAGRYWRCSVVDFIVAETPSRVDFAQLEVAHENGVFTR
jgi:hypothetical protein